MQLSASATRWGGIIFLSALLGAAFAFAVVARSDFSNNCRVVYTQLSHGPQPPEFVRQRERALAYDPTPCKARLLKKYTLYCLGMAILSFVFLVLFWRMALGVGTSAESARDGGGDISRRLFENFSIGRAFTLAIAAGPACAYVLLYLDHRTGCNLMQIAGGGGPASAVSIAACNSNNFEVFLYRHLALSAVVFLAIASFAQFRARSSK